MGSPSVSRGRGPSLSERAPANGAMNRGVAVQGRSRRPAGSGPYPRLIWKDCDIKKVAEKMAPEAKNAVALAAENCRSRKSLMGAMGAEARRSQARIAARTNSAWAMRRRLAASQLVPPDSTSDQMTARAPRLAEAAPARSRAAPLAGASGRRSLDKAAPANP